LPVDLGNRRIEGIDVLEVVTQQKALPHAAAQGLAQNLP
jgi:hypothetical protein